MGVDAWNMGGSCAVLVETRVGVAEARLSRRLGATRAVRSEARPLRAGWSGKQRLVARHLLAAALGIFLALSCEGIVRGVTQAEPTMFHGDADGYPQP